MTTTATEYTARFPLPTLLVRGRQTVIQCPIYRDGSLAAPSAGTVDIARADGSLLVDNGTGVVSGSVIQYTVTAGVLAATELLGAGWLVTWSVTGADGLAYTFNNEAALVRSDIHPVIGEADLTGRRPEVSTFPPSGSRLQDWIDQSWEIIQRRFLSDRRFPWLILSPHALYDTHLALSMHLAYGYAASALNSDGYRDERDWWARQYEAAWSALSLEYDSDQGGDVDGTRIGAGSIFNVGGGGTSSLLPWGLGGY